MRRWKKGLLATLIALCAIAGFPHSPYAGAAEKTPFEPVSLTQLKDGDRLYEAIMRVVTTEIELSKEDAAAIAAEDFYEVDLGNYPKGYTRQFISFIYNYEWIELVLVATNDDASKIRLLDRAASSESGDMFLNTAKLDFSTEENRIHVWTQVPFRAYESWVELEWAGDRFYVLGHEFDDPTANYYEEKAALLKAKNLEGLIELYALDDPMYPGAYAETYTLAAPTLKLAHQKALQANQKKDPKTAVSYLEYGLNQYGDAFGTWDYSEGKLAKEEIVGDADSSYKKSRLSLGTYVGILNDYGYFLSLTGQNKKAKLVLSNVIKLVPSRTVAYLNLADVEWALGQKSSAKGHYKTYWDQLGSKASTVAPKRVQERMNSK